MSTIAEENAKRIRKALEVHCGVSSRLDVALTFSVSGWVGRDSALSSLTSDNKSQVYVTDLYPGGFPVDGSRTLFYTPFLSSSAKIGLISGVGTVASITVTAAVAVPAITVYAQGTGTITAGGVTYDIKPITIIPMGTTTKTLSFAPDDDSRVIVMSIVPGVIIEFDQTNIIQCTVALRSDLGRESNWQVSELSVSAYYPDDISNAIAQIDEDTPIYYYSGYPGDYSETRYFYLTEAEQEQNIITIKGQDASARLGEKTIKAQLIQSTGANGVKTLYNLLANIISKSGIKLAHKESAPASGASHAAEYLLIEETNASDIVADIMNLSHTGARWLTFVDAGIPTLTHSKPTSKWTIKESECADVVEQFEKRIVKVTTEHDDGIHTKVTTPAKTVVMTPGNIAKKEVEHGVRYTQKLDQYYSEVAVTQAKDIAVTLEKVKWTANSKYTFNGKPVTPFTTYITGRPISIVNGAESVSVSGIGGEMKVDPLAFGRVYDGATFVYPNYNRLFSRKVRIGSFTWRGHPHMQPRDVFTFKRLNGSNMTCTIESIELTHEGGGTTAVINYREGIV